MESNLDGLYYTPVGISSIQQSSKGGLIATAVGPMGIIRSEIVTPDQITYLGPSWYAVRRLFQLAPTVELSHLEEMIDTVVSVAIDFLEEIASTRLGSLSSPAWDTGYSENKIDWDRVSLSEVVKAYAENDIKGKLTSEQQRIALGLLREKLPIKGVSTLTAQDYQMVATRLNVGLTSYEAFIQVEFVALICAFAHRALQTEGDNLNDFKF